MAARSGVYSTATDSARSPGLSEVRAHKHGGVVSHELHRDRIQATQAKGKKGQRRAARKVFAYRFDEHKEHAGPDDREMVRLLIKTNEIAHPVVSTCS